MKFENRNPKIFIISGKASSGKDLVSDIICNNYNDKKCKKLSYAYYLKQYVKNITGWDGSEESKPRDLLQSIGIDLLKNKIDNDFLINRMCEDISVYSYFYDVIVITDARLVDEIEVVKNKFLNVKTIRVNRNKENNLTLNQKKHITETNLDNYQNFDYIIENNEDYDKLVIDTKNILEVENNEA
ncbi:MAG: hypothetical protein E7166_05985 [Firmicutes bacterium]|nr:hypothetical protein [Bacillota bacterium]